MAVSLVTHNPGFVIVGPDSWENGVWRSLLFRAGSTIQAQRLSALTVSAFTILNEYDGAGYTRATLTSKAVTSPAANYDSDSWDYGSPAADPAGGATGQLCYFDPDGTDDDSQNIPMYSQTDEAAALQGDGSLYTYTVPAAGPMRCRRDSLEPAP